MENSLPTEDPIILYGNGHAIRSIWEQAAINDEAQNKLWTIHLRSSAISISVGARPFCKNDEMLQISKDLSEDFAHVAQEITGIPISPDGGGVCVITTTS